MIKVSQVTEKSEGDIIFTPHCHSTIEVDYFIEGSGRYSVAGTEHSISPGDVFVFSNNIILYCLRSIFPLLLRSDSMNFDRIIGKWFK